MKALGIVITLKPETVKKINKIYSLMTGIQMDRAQAHLKETHSQIQGMLVSSSTVSIDVRSKLQAIHELASSISRDVATLLGYDKTPSHNLSDMNIPDDAPVPRAHWVSNFPENKESYTPMLMDMGKHLDKMLAVGEFFLKPDRNYTPDDGKEIESLLEKLEKLTDILNAIPRSVKP